VDALMVSVAVVFPFTVTEVGFKVQLIPVGACPGCTAGDGHRWVLRQHGKVG
jgi:hypothetical protein